MSWLSHTQIINTNSQQNIKVNLANSAVLRKSLQLNYVNPLKVDLRVAPTKGFVPSHERLATPNPNDESRAKAQIGNVADEEDNKEHLIVASSLLCFQNGSQHSIWRQRI